jgi:hypothetical protein
LPPELPGSGCQGRGHGYGDHDPSCVHGEKKN